MLMEMNLHHTIYLYNYAGALAYPELIRYVTDNLYHSDQMAFAEMKIWDKCLHGSYSVQWDFIQ